MSRKCWKTLGPQTFDYRLILLHFQGAGGVDQAAAPAQVRKRLLDRLTLPRLKH
jgi:hypothetical protein